MPAQVFFMDARSRSGGSSSLAKIKALLKRVAEAEPGALRKGELCAIKIHFGELGNDAYMSPVLARAAADLALEAGAKPFFTDTNTLYTGSRSNAVDHLNTAIAHGFVPEVCGAPVVIADGLTSENWREVPLPDACTRFRSAKIAGGILEADCMIVLSHFKGHEMAGFGGAVKNLAMGCAPWLGKREQHSVKFRIKEGRCVACGRCVPVCPSGAITRPGDGKAVIDQELCIGCGECLAYCAPKAIVMDWDVALPEFTEKMTEYALGALHGKKDRVLYLSVLSAISPLCDCTPWSDAPIVPDLGFLASTDPVAIDQAALDLVNAAPVRPGSALDGKAGPGDDKFKALHPNTAGDIQLSHGQAIGLGSRDYELVRL
ncbi:MAG: DUF362 domain-containing protein [Spirochaetia bacterium]|nr:DUF362 domain-containing protein [Spirochaetia bacterium]